LGAAPAEIRLQRFRHRTQPPNCAACIVIAVAGKRGAGDNDFYEHASLSNRGSKEKWMKRRFSLWLSLPAAVGLLAFALMPALAQQNAAAPGAASDMGKIHGQITNPTGQSQPGGEIALSTDGGRTLKFTFPVDDNGQYSGQAPAGTYMVIYREKDTPPGKMVDDLENVKIVAGQDTAADIDMSRAAYIAKMTPDQQKQLEELKKQNEGAMAANKVIASLNADLKTVNSDIQDAENANQTAAQQLGSGATVPAVAAKAAEIQNQKYTDVVTLMQKDTQLKPDEPLLWAELAAGQKGLKQYDQALTSYQKALSLEQASKKPNPQILGNAESGIGECYARTGKVQEANAAFDAAAKADPPHADMYYRNQAVIFFQEHNAAAQVTAADQAIQLDPSMPDQTKALLYYIKGQGLVQNATVDPKTQKIVLPPECEDAYQKYLQLAPNGQFAAEVKGILQQADDSGSNSTKKASKKR
jgi:tetratricopeptide (TPR) repeat protein